MSVEIKLPEDFQQHKEVALKKVLQSKYRFPVRYLPHKSNASHCLSPFRHIHVAWNGNVLYCTDFYDFAAGNAKHNDIIAIYLATNFRTDLEVKLQQVIAPLAIIVLGGTTKRFISYNAIVKLKI